MSVGLNDDDDDDDDDDDAVIWSPRKYSFNDKNSSHKYSFNVKNSSNSNNSVQHKYQNSSISSNLV